MITQSPAVLTLTQYLELERASECRHEFYQGRMYPKASGSFRHAVIIGNLVCELGNALQKSPCLVMASAMRIRVSPQGLHTYPDVVVIQDKPKLADDFRDTVSNPTVLVEVLSPSTEAYDRGFKSAQYRTLESLQEYVLVSQTEARVEAFRRQADHTWLLSESIGLDATCEFHSVDCRIPLAEIYDKVTFEETNE
ncbi:MAG: Uma2 family endonuclease [Acidobacteriota bacterium]